MIFNTITTGETIERKTLDEQHDSCGHVAGICESCTSELNAFADAVDAQRADEADGDNARCEAAAGANPRKVEAFIHPMYSVSRVQLGIARAAGWITPDATKFTTSTCGDCGCMIFHEAAKPCTHCDSCRILRTASEAKPAPLPTQSSRLPIAAKIAATAKSFACVAGTSNANGKRNITITSPRTGRTIVIDRDAAGRVNPRLFTRVLAARAKGIRLVSFTSDELKALAKLAAAGEKPAMSRAGR